ncbi:MAG: hypothetical protein ACI89S_000001 [Gammaproteobacteria bacterium]
MATCLGINLSIGGEITINRRFMVQNKNLLNK